MFSRTVGPGIHGVTIGTSLGVHAVARELCMRSGKDTLGVNKGVRRPSSAAVIRATGEDGSGGYKTFLGGEKKLISSFDQSVSDVGWRRVVGGGTEGSTEGRHLTTCMGEKSSSGRWTLELWSFVLMTLSKRIDSSASRLASWSSTNSFLL